MTGKTHIFLGTAAALLMIRPETPETCVTALIGGALGGIISDIDMHDNRSKKDGLYARLIVLGLIAAALISDKFSGSGLIAQFKGMLDKTTAVGAGAFLLLCIFGILQPHRKFTHSVTAAGLFSAAIGMIYLPLCVPFAAGFISHLAADILNKRKLLLFWPLKAGVCFSLCYSNKLADKLFFAAGLAATAYLAGLPLFMQYKDELLSMLNAF